MKSNRRPEPVGPQIAAFIVVMFLGCVFLWHCMSVSKKSEFTPGEWQHAKRTGQMERDAKAVQDRIRWQNG